MPVGRIRTYTAKPHEVEQVWYHADAADLVLKVEALASIQVEGVTLDFTPGQKRELKRLADRQGITYEEIVARTVKSMEEQFFSHAY